MALCQVLLKGSHTSEHTSEGRDAKKIDPHHPAIAATAVAHKATLVTADRKHFENIEGLKLEVWPTE